MYFPPNFMTCSTQYAARSAGVSGRSRYIADSRFAVSAYLLKKENTIFDESRRSNILEEETKWQWISKHYHDDNHCRRVNRSFFMRGYWGCRAILAGTRPRFAELFSTRNLSIYLSTNLIIKSDYQMCWKDSENCSTKPENPLFVKFADIFCVNSSLSFSPSFNKDKVHGTYIQQHTKWGSFC